MAEKHFVVQGATCQCKLSKEPNSIDILQVKTQSKHYANDKDAAKKLVATDKEIGQTMQKNTFGQCKNQPSGNDFLPCIIDITEWSGTYTKITYSNQGKPLLEDSKATCSKGTPSCIIIKNHGQIAEVSKKNIQNTNPEIFAQILPGIDLSDLETINTQLPIKN
ncbi:DUF4280 domain-containing protein [Flavobacterium plurextorum]|uniref:DUF4280 domain-containing protein n=1 Tax=Flavobacterium plurextorum TaxID=1114867 RepID=UPI00375654F3